MIRVLTSRPRVVELDDDDVPEEAGPGHISIAVERVGVCGSDAHVYEGTHPYLAYPQIQGHEVVGRVVAVGAGVSRPVTGERVVLEPTVPCGDCVACRRGSPNCCVHLSVMGVTQPGGLRETVTVPASMVHGVGDLDPDIAVLVEPLAVAVHGLERGGTRAGDLVVVMGAGSIGRSVVLAALDRGASVLVAERTPARADLVRHLGVSICSTDEHEVRNAVRDFAGADGPGVIIDTTGSGELISLALDVVAHAGRVVVIGISQEELCVPVALLSRKEASLLGSRNSEANFPHAIDVARRNAGALRSMISVRLPLERAEEAFRSVLDRTIMGKVLIVVDGGA